MITQDSYLKPLIEEAIDIIERNRPPRRDATVRSLFSGGKDSLVTTHIAQTVRGFNGVCYVNTKTGPLSQEHALSTQQQAAGFGWDWLEKSPATTYSMLVVKSGFPGPGSHSWMYRMLKERSIKQLTKAVRKADKVDFVLYTTGIRRHESQRRANAPETKTVSRNEVWVSPIINWRNEDVRNYLDLTGLSVAHYHHSVDCGCGAFAQPGEREEMLAHPKQRVYVLALERMVREAATIASVTGEPPIPERFCQWGHGLSGKGSKNEPIDAVSICNDCHGRLAKNGDVGVDVDAEMVKRKQQGDRR